MLLRMSGCPTVSRLGGAIVGDYSILGVLFFDLRSCSRFYASLGLLNDCKIHGVTLQRHEYSRFRVRVSTPVSSGFGARHLDAQLFNTRISMFDGCSILGRHTRYGSFAFLNFDIGSCCKIHVANFYAVHTADSTHVRTTLIALGIQSFEI